MTRLVRSLPAAVLLLGFVAASAAETVDINSASEEALSALIGKRAYTDQGKSVNKSYCDKVAKAIVAGRPYQAVADLRSKEIVSATMFGHIRAGLGVGSTTQPPAGGAAPELPFPKTIDLTAKQSPVRDQARRNTCMAFSTTAGVEAWDKTLDLSEELLYYLLREGDADKKKCLKVLWDLSTPDICDDKCSGATLEDAVKVLQKVGLYAESVWPYDSHDNQTPKVNCHESATWASKAIPVQGKKTVKLGPVVWLAGPDETPKSKRANDPMVLMAILAKGFAVNLALDCAGSGWEGSGMRIDVELDPKSKKPVKPEGGHGVLLVGYDYDKKLFKFKNSWAADWADNGYGYLTFDYIKTYVYGGFYATGIVK